MRACVWTFVMALAVSLAASPARALIRMDTVFGQHGGGRVNLPPIPPETVPAAPSHVSILTKTATSITFEWQDRSTVETGFTVERQEAGGDWVVVEAHLVPLARSFGWGSYTDEGLNADTRYCYRVVPYNDAGMPPYVPEPCAYTDRPEPAGALLARLRVLTHNVYGLDDGPFLVNNCETRAAAFGEAVAIAEPAYDIVGLQEYYDNFDFETVTCDAGPLLDAIHATGRYLDSDNSKLFYPTGEWWTGEADGAIGIFTRHPIIAFAEEEWDDNGSFPENLGARQGFIFARIQIPGTSVTVDTYVVHIYSESADGCHRACQQAELQQLADGIAAYSGSSGNPVLIVGDFNVAGPPADSSSPEYPDFLRYQDILSTLRNPRDLWLENHPEAPGYTFNDCFPSNCPESGKRIDYIFVPTDPSLTTGPYEIFIRNRDDVRVVIWGSGFGAVSDHYGVEATIEIRERPSFPGGQNRFGWSEPVAAANPSVVNPEREQVFVVPGVDGASRLTPVNPGLQAEADVGAPPTGGQMFFFGNTCVERTAYVKAGSWRTLESFWNSKASAFFRAPAGARIKVRYGVGWFGKDSQKQTLDGITTKTLSVGGGSVFYARIQMKVAQHADVTYTYCPVGP